MKNYKIEKTFGVMENSNSAMALLKKRLKNYKLYPNPFAVREQKLVKESHLWQPIEGKHCKCMDNAECGGLGSMKNLKINIEILNV